MRSLKKQRRIQVIALAFVAVAVTTVAVGFAFRDGINLFYSPTQVMTEPPSEAEVFRIGGLVEEGSVIRGEGETVSFVVTDGNAGVPVTYTGILPDLFIEGQGMVGRGRYVNGTFEADEILARHDETYMPVEVVDALKEQGVYQEPDS